ncbi:glycosyltransferase family 9 protein [Acetobacteraceae bacterium H6797]|nr:glycosyltransferase family 9 protein [Acetobacteraceae bacterium H6797]
MRILFITSSRIGDAVLSTGLADHLLRTYPEARITVACGRLAEGIYARMPHVERLIVLHKKPYLQHWFELWRQVAFTWWDLVIDLRGSAISYFLPARRRAVKHGGRRSGHRLLHIAETLGVKPAPRPVAWYRPEDAAKVAPYIQGEGPLLVLGVTASQPFKVWSGANFAALARAIAAPDGPLPGARIALLGGPGAKEAAMAKGALEGLPEAIDLVGKLDIPAVTALLAQADLFVGNDSGLTHLSAATGSPTLALFGPTLASEYAPVGARSTVIFADGPPGEAPIEALPVERALEGAKRLLAGDFEPVVPSE